MICLIYQPLLTALRRDWYRSKGLLKGFKLALRPWESSKNWWRYDQMKFMTLFPQCSSILFLNSSTELLLHSCYASYGLAMRTASFSSTFLNSLSYASSLTGYASLFSCCAFCDLATCAAYALPFSFPTMNTPYTCVPFLHT